MSDSAALTFLHAMIFSHLSYCITTWTMVGPTTLTPVEVLYKKALKILDKKPISYHHCNILDKYNHLSFCKFSYCCLIYKTLHGLAPPCLQDSFKYRQSRATRSVANREIEVPFRKTAFSHNALSIKGSALWNSMPVHIRECPSLATFKKQVKTWLRGQQMCTHI